MGYLHINNLYKDQDILEFKRCYALEKIHGTSAHIKWENGVLTFFSGGESHKNFVALFDQEALKLKFLERFGDGGTCVVYGEAYGGKQQRMSPTYGPNLKFIAFDVMIGESWLNVGNAANFVTEHLGLEFVDFAVIPTDLAAIDAERDKPSTQAIRNGMGNSHIREGVVLRPFYEYRDNRGNRVIAKHKRKEFTERAGGDPNVDLDPSKRERLESVQAIALEWVTPTRLEHVIDHILAERVKKVVGMEDCKLLIERMIEDVLREGSDEVVDSKDLRKVLGARTVGLFKERLEASLNDRTI